MGLSIGILKNKRTYYFLGVTNIGQGVVTLHDLDEKYVVTFPNGYGRSIMSTPWVELGGKVVFFRSFIIFIILGRSTMRENGLLRRNRIFNEAFLWR